MMMGMIAVMTIACVAEAWKGARKNWERLGDTRGERERLPERPMKIVFIRFLRVRKIPIC